MLMEIEVEVEVEIHIRADLPAFLQKISRMKPIVSSAECLELMQMINPVQRFWGIHRLLPWQLVMKEGILGNV